MNIESEDGVTCLLELAANNDLHSFKKSVDREPPGVDEVGLWYGRQNGSNQMLLQHMTPLMVAATYGSVDVLKLILSFPEVDVNRSCGVDQSTALHYAASSGTINAVEVVKLLMGAGADPSLSDANGRRPGDVIVVSPKLLAMKCSLQMLLTKDASFEERDLRVSVEISNLNSNTAPTSPSQAFGSPGSASFSQGWKTNEVPGFTREKKEYPVDPFLPDIKNSIYSSDEFRMFSFKVRPCSRAYSHDWTECPFVHPGENARRRDPRKYHYSCVPCPDFRKGACRRGDMCEYAHGVFECWLHPAQYRTRLCKDGTACNRRVCFFAHTEEELRALYMSTSSAAISPRSGSSAVDAMDFASAMILPGSPCSVSVMSPSPFTPPMSPANGMSNANWRPSQQQNVPALHLSGGNFQLSRLRSSLNAKDIVPGERLSLYTAMDSQKQQLLNEMSLLNISACPSNLEDIFSAESSSPTYSDAVFSPTHKSAVLNQFQQQQQGMLSPKKTMFSARKMEHSLLQTPFGVPVTSSGRMSPGHADSISISPMSARSSLHAHREKQQPEQFRSLSCRDLGSSAAAAVASMELSNFSEWGFPRRQSVWDTENSEFGRLKRSSSFELVDSLHEPDLSWVQSLFKESPHVIKSAHQQLPTASSGFGLSGAKLNDQVEQSVIDAWLEQRQLDQLRDK